jgi:hypothetical protein
VVAVVVVVMMDTWFHLNALVWKDWYKLILRTPAYAKLVEMRFLGQLGAVKSFDICDAAVQINTI